MIPYMSHFEFKERLSGKENFYISLMGKKLVIKNMSMFLRFWIDLKGKR